jgi:hypothetical protein
VRSSPTSINRVFTPSSLSRIMLFAIDNINFPGAKVIN